MQKDNTTTTGEKRVSSYHSGRERERERMIRCERESIETKPFNLHERQKETNNALNRTYLELVNMTLVNCTGVVFWMKKERRFLEFSKKQTCPSVISRIGSGDGR